MSIKRQILKLAGKDRYKELSPSRGKGDAQGNTTTVTYDDYGRRVAIDNPDTGKTQWWYDDAGNMIARQTANLQKKHQYIRYSYRYHQLKMIDNSKNDVVK
jgi:YD repeat-containing protein